MGFCLATRFHPAMRHAAPVRRELGVPTVFNFLGPLSNPARAGRQVVGVGDPAMAERMLAVLEENGARHAVVCFGHDGLDELSVASTSTLLESVREPDGSRRRRQLTVDPQALGLAPARREALRGGDAACNADAVRRVIGGERGPQRDFAVLNAAAGLMVAGLADDLGAGVGIAADVLDRCAAQDVFERLLKLSNELAEDRPR
jgi:anthranilate phosphoribosyltransferase